MMTANCTFHRYKLRLVQPITINGRQIDCREGIIIIASDSDGRHRYGEIAPLPGLHAESIEDVIPLLSRVRQILTKQHRDDQPSHLPPSVRCGMEMAAMYLSAQSTLESAPYIDICGLLMPGTDDMPGQVQRLAQQGYKTVKIKVGRQSLQDDIAMVKEIRRRAGSSVKLRLDANRAWKAEDALTFCDQLAAQAIEYIEEPVDNTEDLLACACKLQIAPALDETLAQIEPDDLPDDDSIAALILKPAVLGGLAATSNWIRLAQKRRIKAVISCCFESSVAVRAYAAFAAQMGIADAHPGLDTLKFFRQDVLEGKPIIADGKIDMRQIVEAPIVFREGALKEVAI